MSMSEFMSTVGQGIQQLYSFCHYVLCRFKNDGCFYRASALTFTNLLAIVPLMFVVLSTLSAFPLFENLSNNVQNFIFENFVPSAGQVVKKYVLDFVDKTSNLSFVGLAFLILTAILMLYTIEQALNNIWRVHRHRRGVSTFMLYWAILTLTPILLGIGFGLSTYVLSLPGISSAAAMLGIKEWMFSMLTFSLIAAVFSIIYITVPNCHVPVRSGVLGGIIAAFLYEIARWGFALYLTKFSTYQLIYGALATIPIFLIWLYLLWLIILLGAEITHCLTYRYTITSKQILDPFTHACQWLALLWQAQKKGKTLSLLQLVCHDRYKYEVMPDEQIEALLTSGFIMQVSSGKYVLVVDFSQTTLADIHERLPWKFPFPAAQLTSTIWRQQFSDVLQQGSHNLKQILSVKLVDIVQESISSEVVVINT